MSLEPLPRPPSLLVWPQLPTVGSLTVAPQAARPCPALSLQEKGCRGDSGEERMGGIKVMEESVGGWKTVHTRAQELWGRSETAHNSAPHLYSHPLPPKKPVPLKQLVTLTAYL